MPDWDFTKIKTLIRQKAADEDRNLTYETIAAEIGVSKGTVDRYANRPVVAPDLNVVWSFCEYFNVDVDYFIAQDEGVDEENKKRAIPAFGMTQPIAS